MARVFVSVGSNIDPETNVLQALKLLSAKVSLVAVSTFYLTEPLGASGQPPFYNGVVEIETDIPPIELKNSVLRRIEDELGRVRSETKHAPRTIDLDILVYGDLILETAELVIPDPEIVNRAFLAIPLYELAPDMVLPGVGVALAEIASDFKDHPMQPLREYTAKLRQSTI